MSQELRIIDTLADHCPPAHWTHAPVRKTNEPAPRYSATGPHVIIADRYSARLIATVSDGLPDREAHAELIADALNNFFHRTDLLEKHFGVGK